LQDCRANKGIRLVLGPMRPRLPLSGALIEHECPRCKREVELPLGDICGPCWGDIERRAGSKVTDVLAAVPGVRLVPTGDPFGRLIIQMRGSLLSRGGICRPRIFVDGIIYNRGDSRPTGVDEWGNLERSYDPDQNPDFYEIEEPSIDQIVQPNDIAGIEVYRSGSQVPVKFGGTSIETLCGVIAIWTRVGELRQRGGD